MDIQTEVQKIHHQYGVSEKANYEIQKLFGKAIKEAVTEALRIHDVVGRSELLKIKKMAKSKSDIVYRGFNITVGKTQGGKTWYAAESPTGGPPFFCTQLAIAKKFIDVETQRSKRRVKMK